MASSVSFRYPRSVVSNAVGPAVAAIGVPIYCPMIVIGIQAAFGGPIFFDVTRISPTFGSFLFAGWLFLMAGNVPKAYACLQQFTLNEEGIQRSVLGRRSTINWSEVTGVDKILGATYENFGWRQAWIDETSLSVKSQRRKFVIYDRLQGFTEFKDTLSALCRRHSIPQVSIDKSMTTFSRMKADNPALYRQLRRTGLRNPVDHL